MKTLLTLLNFAEFGVEGEVITLPKYFGRKLIHNKKAVYASPENLKEFASSVSTATLLYTGVVKFVPKVSFEGITYAYLKGK